MSFLWSLGLLACLCILTTVLAKIDISAGRSAYRLLENGWNMAVGPEEEDEPKRPSQQKVKRYVTPYTKKLVAARQQWRCATCKSILSADFHCDHKLALFKGGDNDLDNLQALCPTCHQLKSALERA